MPSPSYISREDLSTFVLLPIESRPAMAIIDVRDDDHVGGHIFTSTHVPSSSLDYRVPELVRKLKDMEIVIFHCALSQQRGPSAARRYVRERARLLSVKQDASGVESCEEEKAEVVQEEKTAQAEAVEQKVYILDGGFVKWQEK
jgi:rhodanese-related sulfurtransferase